MLYLSQLLGRPIREVGGVWVGSLKDVIMRRGGEVLLVRDVLDKQLIDVDGKRVVRVNDVQLVEAGGEWRVTGADVTLAGLWRRLAPQTFTAAARTVEVIDWADV